MARAPALVIRVLALKSTKTLAGNAKAASNAGVATRNGCPLKDLALAPSVVVGNGRGSAGNKKRVGRSARAPGNAGAFAKHALPWTRTTSLSNATHLRTRAKSIPTSAPSWDAAPSLGTPIAETALIEGSLGPTSNGRGVGGRAVTPARSYSFRLGRWSIIPRCAIEGTRVALVPTQEIRPPPAATPVKDWVSKGAAGRGTPADISSSGGGMAPAVGPSSERIDVYSAIATAAALSATTLVFGPVIAVARVVLFVRACEMLRNSLYASCCLLSKSFLSSRGSSRRCYSNYAFWRFPRHLSSFSKRY